MPSIKEASRSLGQTQANKMYSPTSNSPTGSAPSLRADIKVIGDANRLAKDLNSITENLYNINKDKNELDVRSAKLVANDHVMAYAHQAEELENSTNLTAQEKQSRLTNHINTMVSSTMGFDGNEDMQFAYNTQFVDYTKKDLSKRVSNWIAKDKRYNINIMESSANDYLNAGGSNLTKEQVRTAYSGLVDIGILTTSEVDAMHSSVVSQEIQNDFNEIGTEYLYTNAMTLSADGVWEHDELKLHDFIVDKFKNVDTINNIEANQHKEEILNTIRTKSLALSNVGDRASIKRNKGVASDLYTKTSAAMEKAIKLSASGSNPKAIGNLLTKDNMKAIGELTNSVWITMAQKQAIATKLDILRDTSNKYNTMTTLFNSITPVVNGAGNNAVYSSNLKTLVDMSKNDIVDTNGNSIQTVAFTNKAIQQKLIEYDDSLKSMPVTSQKEIVEYRNKMGQIASLASELGTVSPLLEGYKNSFTNNNITLGSVDEIVKALEYMDYVENEKPNDKKLWTSSANLRRLKEIMVSDEFKSDAERIIAFNRSKKSNYGASFNDVTVRLAVTNITKYMEKEKTEYTNTKISATTTNALVSLAQYKEIDVSDEDKTEDLVDTYTWRTEGWFKSIGTKAQTILSMDNTSEEKVRNAIDAIAIKNNTDSTSIRVESTFVDGVTTYSMYNKYDRLIGTYGYKDINALDIEYRNSPFWNQIGIHFK